MIPRKSYLCYSVPAELAISNAVNEIEKLGADKRLTDAVCLMAEALAHVSNYVDEQLKQK